MPLCLLLLVMLLLGVELLLCIVCICWRIVGDLGCVAIILGFCCCVGFTGGGLVGYIVIGDGSILVMVYFVGGVLNHL